MSNVTNAVVKTQNNNGIHEENLSPEDKLALKIKGFIASRASTAEGFGRTDGNKILLPKNLTVRDGIKELIRIEEQEETVVDINHEFKNWHADDALYALNQVLKREFGWVNATAIKSFFGDINPDYVEIAIGINPDNKEKTVSCVEGQVSLASMENGTVIFRRIRNVLFLRFTVKQKYRDFAEYIINEVKEELINNSIYRGKVLLAHGESLKFINVKPTDLEFPVDKEAVVSLLKNRMAVNRERTTALFYGDVGTGSVKTFFH